MTIIYLYIKTHHVKTSKGITLKYFGRTLQDPFKYHGSGKYWKAHRDKYGEGMDTKIYGEFDLETQKELLKETALRFSRDNDIVKSKEWANLEVEDGLSGGLPVELLSNETRAVRSASQKGKPRSAETKARISASLAGNTRGFGYKHSAESRAKMSSSQMGNTNSLGHKQSVDARANTSAAMKGSTNSLGYKHSAEARANMSTARVGVKRGPYKKKLTFNSSAKNK